MAFEWPVRVYIEDTDFGGIVYYVNYLKFMERARTELLRSAGWSQQTLAQQNLIFVVGEVQTQYLSPAKLDDELVIRTVVKKPQGARVKFSQAVVKAGSDRVLCQAEIEVVAVTSAMRPKRWPKELINSITEAHPEAWLKQE